MNILKWFKPAPIQIWRTDRREYLRSEKSLALELEIGFEYFDIYAVYQTDISTGKTRIVEASSRKW